MGSGKKYQAIVRNEAQKACLFYFGQMETEDFYNPHKRRITAQRIMDDLVAALQPKHVELIDVLIRNVQFDPQYETKIRQKKLADQEVELNKSLARAAEKSGATQVIEAETEKKAKIIVEEKKAAIKEMEAEADLTIATIMAEYSRYAQEKKADADLIAARKDAEGSLLVMTAEAKGEELRNAAMAGKGGNILVALEAARNLRFGDIVLSTRDVDFLDVSSMVIRLGLPPEKK